MLKHLHLVLLHLHTLMHSHFLGVLLVRILSNANNKNPIHTGFNSKGYFFSLYITKSSDIVASRGLGSVTGDSSPSIPPCCFLPCWPYCQTTSLPRMVSGSSRFTSSEVYGQSKRSISLFQVLKQNIRISLDWTRVAWLRVNIHLWIYRMVSWMWYSADWVFVTHLLLQQRVKGRWKPCHSKIWTKGLAQWSSG